MREQMRNLARDADGRSLSAGLHLSFVKILRQQEYHLGPRPDVTQRLPAVAAHNPHAQQHT